MSIWLWFFLEDEMLREIKFYLHCSRVAVLCGIYGIILGNPVTPFGIFPLTFLILQKSARQVYLKLIKREPKVDLHGKFADFVYSIILFFGTIYLSMLITGRLE